MSADVRRLAWGEAPAAVAALRALMSEVRDAQPHRRVRRGVREVVAAAVFPAASGSGDAAGGATAAALRDEAGEAEFYDCGRAGCQKTFRHEHVSSALPVSFFKPLPAPEATRSSLGPAQLRPEM